MTALNDGASPASSTYRCQVAGFDPLPSRLLKDRGRGPSAHTRQASVATQASSHTHRITPVRHTGRNLDKGGSAGVCSLYLRSPPSCLSTLCATTLSHRPEDRHRDICLKFQRRTPAHSIHVPARASLHWQLTEVIQTSEAHCIVVTGPSYQHSQTPHTCSWANIQVGNVLATSSSDTP